MIISGFLIDRSIWRPDSDLSVFDKIRKCYYKKTVVVIFSKNLEQILTFRIFLNFKEKMRKLMRFEK